MLLKIKLLRWSSVVLFRLSFVICLSLEKDRPLLQFVTIIDNNIRRKISMFGIKGVFIRLLLSFLFDPCQTFFFVWSQAKTKAIIEIHLMTKYRKIKFEPVLVNGSLDSGRKGLEVELRGRVRIKVFEKPCRHIESLKTMYVENWDRHDVFKIVGTIGINFSFLLRDYLYLICIVITNVVDWINRNIWWSQNKISPVLSLAFPFWMIATQEEDNVKRRKRSEACRVKLQPTWKVMRKGQLTHIES